ncbi:MAG: DMT family transporter [Christensenellaceae bacterium]
MIKLLTVRIQFYLILERHSMKSSIKYDMLLLCTAIVWGTGFIASKFALSCGLPASLIITLRMLFAALLLLLIFFKQIKSLSKPHIKHGIIAGILMGIGYLTQTIAMNHTSVSNNAFLTTLNVVFVPFISWIILKKRPPAKTFLSVAVGFLGIFILTRIYETKLSFNVGDVLSLICAAVFACQIAYIGFAAKNVQAGSFSFVQIVITAAISLIYFALFESDFAMTATFGFGILATVYLGVVCTAFGFFLQCFAQAYVPASRAALILSLEGFTATLISVGLGIEPLRLSIIIGGLLIMLSIFILEFNLKKTKLSTF